MDTRKFRSVSLHVERLEERAVMAGNVTAMLNNGVLTLIGDNLANEIMAYQTVPGTYKIIGNPGTTVNGGLSFTAPGVTGDLNIMMGEGDDFLQLMMVVPGNLNIDMGRGNDYLSLGGFFELPVGCQPDLGYAVDVKGGLTVNTGAGDDVLNMFDSRVGGAANLSTGSDNDRVLLFNAHFLNLLNLQTGTSDDTAEIDTVSVVGQAKIVTGSGDDTVFLNNSVFMSGLTLDGGSGKADSLMNNLDSQPTTIKGFEVSL